MSVPTSSQEFLDALRASELIDAAKLAGLPDDPRDAAAELVRAGLLTGYQANQLLQGKSRGFLLASYKILQPIGKGGMGTVFLAEHTAMRRRIALKVIPANQIKDKLSLERFHREARSAAALDHPNIVMVYDVGQAAKAHYLAMEYVEGEDLQSVLDKGGPPHFSEAVHWAYQAAAGLHHAHEKGLVHRDVKPANLIRSKDGAVKILDMGLARSFQEEADNLTGALGTDSDATGTADYVSPEQALNEPVDQRADVYSLGATLFALVAGFPPFRGTMLQKLAQHQTVAPPRLSDVKPEVPQGLSDVVAKMMAKKPSARYQTAAEVMDALSPWLAAGTRSKLGIALPAEPEPLPPVSPSAKLSRRTQKKLPRVAAVAVAERSFFESHGMALSLAGGGLTLLLAVCGVAWLFLRTRAPIEEPAPWPAEPPPRPAVVWAPASPAPAPRPAPVKQDRPVDHSRFDLLALEKVGTATTQRAIFDRGQTFSFATRTTEWVNDIPFRLPSAADAGNNIIVLKSDKGEQSGGAPESVTVPIGAKAAALHFLSGVAGWGWPLKGEGGRDITGTVAMTAHVRYADGAEEEHVWKNGVEFADWYKRVDVTGSEYAFPCDRGHQVRYLAIRPGRAAEVKEVALRKGEVPQVAPVVLAITVEKPR
jgi:serine/threonine protein kinase